MTPFRCEIALSEARHDFHHATRAMMAAETESARKRHARRAQNAAKRIRDAQRDLAWLACERAA